MELSESRAFRNSSGVYIYKSVENDLKHGNFICKSEENYLLDEVQDRISVEGGEGFEVDQVLKQRDNILR